MTAAQFCRLAAELAEKPEGIRRAVEAMAAGDLATAADCVGGRFSPDWWTAEFFVKRLSDHGATETPRFTAAEPRRRDQQTLFAD